MPATDYNRDFFGTSLNAGSSASDTLGGYQEGLYNDYQRRFQPLIDQYLDKDKGAAELDRRLGRVSVTADKSSEIARLTGQQALGRTGTQMSADQQAMVARNSGINNALAKVSGGASVRQDFIKQQDNTRDFLVNMGRDQLGQDMTTLDQLAATETNRQAYNTQAAAQASAQDDQTNTSLASMAIMMAMMM